MANLNIEQKTISELFSDKKTDFLIPDYQRPYAWEKEECQTLWDDIFSFSFPDKDYSKFNDNDEYFLGPIVTFKNKDAKKEIIDGQQRLTTLMLLLRAFYEKFGNMQDEKSRKTKENLEKCIWKTDEFDTPNKNELKINSEVATDNDKEEFLNILKTGQITNNMKSKYALNYKFFQGQIDLFLSNYPSYFPYFPTRILKNCILLPIEAESQDTALRIFSTLNDRGKPLSDADIFKAQLYKYYSKKGQKEDFIRRWKDLEYICGEIFHPTNGSPMDELFTRYMYFLRAKKEIKLSTTEALRKFYEGEKGDDYSILKRDETLYDLEKLASFWNDVSNQDKDRFSDRILRKLYILNYAPNGMWTYFVSVYFMQNKDNNNNLNDMDFYNFLNKIIAFIWTYAITNPGVNALRTPIYAEMIKIIKNETVTFSDFKFEIDTVKSVFNNYSFNNNRPITKSMLTWWAFNDDAQQLLSLETNFQIEHIFARKLQEREQILSSDKKIENLGNKVLLEKNINIRATDYRVCDKIKYYKGFKNKKGTNIVELNKIFENKTDFTETDIDNRNEKIISSFIDYLKINNLLK